MVTLVEVVVVDYKFPNVIGCSNTPITVNAGGGGVGWGGGGGGGAGLPQAGASSGTGAAGSVIIYGNFA